MYPKIDEAFMFLYRHLRSVVKGAATLDDLGPCLEKRHVMFCFATEIIICIYIYT